MRATALLQRHGDVAHPSTTLWEFSSYSSLRPIEPTVGERARWRLPSAIRRLISRSEARETVDRTSTAAPAPDVLERLAPPIAWDPAVSALSRALEHLERDAPGRMAIAVVGGGTLPAEVVTRWAAHHGHARPASPPLARLMCEPVSLDPRVPASPSLMVVPRLERCYVRHALGLAPLRTLLEGARLRGSIVVACSAWAWAYLERALGVASFFDEVIGNVPFDAARMESWFRPPADAPMIRSCGSGKPLFADSSSGNGETDGPRDAEGFFAWLAGVSNGQPQVAHAIWRHALRTSPDPSSVVTSASARVVWVDVPSKISLPELPTGAGITEAVLLHTLHLHDGLPEELLRALLPIPSADLRRAWSRLRRCGVVVEVEGEWQVPLLSRPAVRRFLREEGFTDDLR